jgi:sigma-B regulation protein RsbU (phosphoserine phosphatase)
LRSETNGPERAARRGLSWRPAVLAAFAGAFGFLLATRGESLIIGAVHGDRAKLEWISDTVVSLGVVALTYLWLNLRESQVRVLALQREQIVLDEQLRLAAEIQRSLLPDIPAGTPGFGWAARMVPAGRIGGDFYDFFQPSARSTFAILGDVSGKGIPAALLLSSLKTLFRATAPAASDPAAIAERISTALYEQHSGMPYVTAILARFDAPGPRLVYVNAGHPPGYVLRDGSATTLDSGGPPLGLLPGARYTAATVDLSPGDVGVLVTDGITEALDTAPVTWAQAVSAVRVGRDGPRSAATICQGLMETAARGHGPEGVDGWQDDRTVFVFTVEAGVDLGASDS